MMMDELVAQYIKLRDKKAVFKAEYDAKKERLDAVLEAIENRMLAEFQNIGVESVRTPVGTAYVSTAVSVTVADWDKCLEFIKANNAWELLERRASKVAVEQYKVANNDLPPGVNWSEKKSVNFRRT